MKRPTGFRNRGTNEVFTDLGEMVLDAQNRYQRCMDVTYCDIECLLDDPDEGVSYILDECGNWNYFPDDFYEVLRVPESAGGLPRNVPGCATCPRLDSAKRETTHKCPKEAGELADCDQARCRVCRDQRNRGEPDVLDELVMWISVHALPGSTKVMVSYDGLMAEISRLRNQRALRQLGVQDDSTKGRLLDLHEIKQVNEKLLIEFPDDFSLKLNLKQIEREIEHLHESETGGKT